MNFRFVCAGVWGVFFCSSRKLEYSDVAGGRRHAIFMNLEEKRISSKQMAPQTNGTAVLVHTVYYYLNTEYTNNI